MPNQSATSSSDTGSDPSAPVRGRALRVLTWNTFLAATMYDRFRRFPSARKALLHFQHELHADLVLMQEFNSIKVGPFSYALFRLCLFLTQFQYPTLLVLLEFCMVFEGFVLPFVLLDYRTEFVEWARQNTEYRYSYNTKLPSYFVNSGLMIMSRIPLELDDVKTTSALVSDPRRWDTCLPRDVSNRPGVLATNIPIKLRDDKEGDADIRWLRLYTLHLVPSLPSTTIPYKLTNFFNALLGFDPSSLRKTHEKMLRDDAKTERAWAVEHGCSNLSFIVAGDFNMVKGSEELERLKTQLGVVEAELTPAAPTINDAPIQIDFICADAKTAQATSLWNAAQKQNNPQSRPSQKKSTQPEKQPVYDSAAIANALKQRGAAVHTSAASSKYPEFICSREEELFESDHYPIYADIFIPFD